ncbi:MAG TPA: cupin domain-containing protein [bacterium]|nr:cupin domain-containing protein [bacterium]HQP97220.1 cupin domain-containing protein [bacterium]
MFIGSTQNVEAKELPIEGVKNATIRTLIGEKEGAKQFATRVVTLKKDGIIPLHSHPLVHEQVILKGKGAILTPDGEREVSPGDFVFVQANEIHGLKNLGDEDFELVCCINLID